MPPEPRCGWLFMMTEVILWESSGENAVALPTRRKRARTTDLNILVDLKKE